MKASKYNFFYPYKKDSTKYVAYNSFSNSLAFLEKDKYEELQAYDEGKIKQLDTDFEHELVKGNFLVEDDADELKLLEHRLNRSRYASGVLGLTIAPTLNCNFRCVYCYEKKCYQNSKMNEETEDAIVTFVQGFIPKITGISISWYGGEPLLAMDVIERLSNKLIGLAKKNKLAYNASMVTNGYLLSRECAMRLAELEVKYIQITVDGDEETHDKKRPLVNGGRTYERIFHNLEEINGQINQVAIRVNIDRNNKSAIKAVNDEIHKRKLINVSVYPAPIRGINDCYDEDSCMGRTDFFDFEYEFLKSLPEKEYTAHIQQKYPVLSGNSCGADNDLAYVIDAEGNLYKCWSDIGDETMKFGNVRTNERNVPREIIYIKENPLNRDSCRECKLLPVCLGGCPYEVRNGVEDKCIYSEKLFGKYLEDIACEISRLHLEKNRKEA